MQALKLAMALAATAAIAAETIPGGGVVAHEWGTFTSVAGPSGMPVQWMALSKAGDLPCFVVRDGRTLKSELVTTVRMETPVIYFYSPRRTSVSVKVRYPAGAMTEWYPPASVDPPARTLEWNHVEILPGADLEFPQGSGASHYYAARETAAAPLRVGKQAEKLLFYRGAGDFRVPVWPRFTGDGKLEIVNAGQFPVRMAMVFENRGGKVGFRAIENLQGTVTVDPPELNARVETVHARLVEALTQFGLYPREAQAMVATWQDSWFEEGTRVFYLAPQELVNEALPLSIAPAPDATVRAFVGRVEMLSPWLKTQLDAQVLSGDTAGLSRHERFLDVFLFDNSRRQQMAPAAEEYVQAYRQRLAAEAMRPSCVN